MTARDGDYGEYEYEVTATIRVYADNDGRAYAAGRRRITLGLGEWCVRLIDEDEERECQS